MLVKYLPAFLRDIKEISCIMQVQDSEFERISRAVKASLDNSFIWFTDSDGLARWERLFGIVAKPADGIEARRREIISRLSERLPYTYNSLSGVMADLYGCDWDSGTAMAVDYERFHVTVYLKLELYKHLEAIERLIRRQLPANMTYEFVMVFVRYGELETFTYGELGSFTYAQIKGGSFESD
jgi:hypothetical protein